MKWTEETAFKFVKEYLEHECLYNIKNNKYKQKSSRDAALRKICEVMDIPDLRVKEALAKIKSFRSTYSQERKKNKDSCKSSAGTEDLYVPCLKWYQLYHDRIMEKELTQSISEDNLNSTVTTVEETASAIDESTSQEGSRSSKDLQDTPSTQETKPAKKPVYSRKRNIKCLESLVNKVNAVGEMIQTPMANNDNEFDIFGRSVAAQLNVMPLILELKAQSHIQNYLTSLRMHSIANPLNLQTYSPPPPSCTTYISTPSPITNSPVSEVSLNNNCTLNVQTNYPLAASPAVYHMPSVFINSSISGPSLDSKKYESTVAQSNDLQGDILELATHQIYD